jgi:beta-glucosidase
VDAAASADVAIVVVGDRAGLFGRGTVGEGNDAESLELPGVQRELVDAVVATGTPVVLVRDRPALRSRVGAGRRRRCAATQRWCRRSSRRGGRCRDRAVLSGAVSPSGRLPVSLPRSAGARSRSRTCIRSWAATAM